MRRICVAITIALSALCLPGQPTFDHSVKPLLTQSCSPCHNDRNASGGVSIVPFTDPSSLVAGREQWEKIVQKVRSGEMPPKGMPRLTIDQIKDLTSVVEGEFEKADRNIKPDPGRVTARRVNRIEY